MKKCLFCDLLNGKNHNGNFPFLPIYETHETVSFLSVPCHGDLQPGHILIIPKKHYEFLEDIPKKILDELIEHCSLACKVLKKDFKACRIQLNNGAEAGQYIPHVHFHIFPFENKRHKKFPSLETLSHANFEKTSEILRKKFMKFSRS